MSWRFFLFLFIIIADTMRANARIHPELLVWFLNVLFIAIGGYLLAPEQAVIAGSRWRDARRGVRVFES